MRCTELHVRSSFSFVQKCRESVNTIGHPGHPALERANTDRCTEPFPSEQRRFFEHGWFTSLLAVPLRNVVARSTTRTALRSDGTTYSRLLQDTMRERRRQQCLHASSGEGEDVHTARKPLTDRRSRCTVTQDKNSNANGHVSRM